MHYSTHVIILVHITGISVQQSWNPYNHSIIHWPVCFHHDTFEGHFHFFISLYLISLKCLIIIVALAAQGNKCYILIWILIKHMTLQTFCCRHSVVLDTTRILYSILEFCIYLICWLLNMRFVWYSISKTVFQRQYSKIILIHCTYTKY